MLKLIKKSILENKQKRLRRRASGVSIILHPDMPNPSMNKMVEAASIVARINSFEPKISALSDSELKNKTQGFKEHLEKKAKDYEQEINDIDESLLSVAIPEEKEKLR